MTTKRLKRALAWVVISPALIVVGVFMCAAKSYELAGDALCAVIFLLEQLVNALLGVWNYAWHGRWEE